MKSAAVLVSVLALLMFVRPASAVIDLDFGTGDSGSGGTIIVTGANTGSGSGIAIDTLTVSVDGGVGINYDVVGTVNGSAESSVGSFDYNTTGNTFTITGSIVCDGNPSESTGPCAGKPVGFVLLANTTLLLGTGTLSLTNTAGGGVDQTAFATGADDKSAALLTALGFSSACTPDLLHPGFCSGWSHMGFTIGANAGVGNTYLANSTDIPDVSGVPEPTSIVLLGTVLVGVTQLIRRRTSKA